MIKIENIEVVGLESAIRGMRNPMNSWDKSDSGGYGCAGDTCKKCEFKPEWCGNTPNYILGTNDQILMQKLVKGGSVHAKYRRMIVVYMDIVAPLYFWKEYDTYKVGTVANSCSTMHKIHAKEFTLEDFSCEHMYTEDMGVPDHEEQVTLEVLKTVIRSLNYAREAYLEFGDKKCWWQMIQLLPSSYNQRRTVMLNYEVLANIYESRKDHKLDEWRDFCKMIEDLPNSWIICGNDSIIFPTTDENANSAIAKQANEITLLQGEYDKLKANYNNLREYVIRMSIELEQYRNTFS